MNKSKIEWCNSTWNPVTGCLHGCKYCYAEKIAKRFGAHWGSTASIEYLEEPYEEYGKINPYPFDFKPTFHRYRLDEPKAKTKSQNIFVCSMADLFGNWVPEEWIDEVLQVCLNADRHRYLFLTKNPSRYDPIIDYTCGEERGLEIDHWDNMWFGTTITCQADMERVKHLETFSEGHKFLSIEPLHEWITLDLSGYRCPNCGSIEVYRDNPNTTPAGVPPFYCDDCGEWEGEEPAKLIEWVIIGAESGPEAEKNKPCITWAMDIVEQCNAAGIPVFMKDNLVNALNLKGSEIIKEFPWKERMV